MKKKQNNKDASDFMCNALLYLSGGNAACGKCECSLHTGEEKRTP